MQWKIRQTSPVTFRAECEDGEEEFVRYDVFTEVWKCSCNYNVKKKLPCKHIKFTLNFLKDTKLDVYDDGKKYIEETE